MKINIFNIFIFLLYLIKTIKYNIILNYKEKCVDAIKKK